HRAALAGRRRDARPGGAHSARRGVLRAVPRRAGNPARGADQRARCRRCRRRRGAGHAGTTRPAGGRGDRTAGEPVLEVAEAAEVAQPAAVAPPATTAVGPAAAVATPATTVAAAIPAAVLAGVESLVIALI